MEHTFFMGKNGCAIRRTHFFTHFSEFFGIIFIFCKIQRWCRDLHGGNRRRRRSDDLWLDVPWLLWPETRPTDCKQHHSYMEIGYAV